MCDCFNLRICSLASAFHDLLMAWLIGYFSYDPAKFVHTGRNDLRRNSDRQSRLTRIKKHPMFLINFQTPFLLGLIHLVSSRGSCFHSLVEILVRFPYSLIFLTIKVLVSISVFVLSWGFHMCSSKQNKQTVKPSISTMLKIMFLVLLLSTLNAAAIKISFKPEDDGILPHNHHSYHQLMKANSPILRNLFFNQ